jgi:hypothetical protein
MAKMTKEQKSMTHIVVMERVEFPTSTAAVYAVAVFPYSKVEDNVNMAAAEAVAAAAPKGATRFISVVANRNAR